jgi:hypothetical protein
MIRLALMLLPSIKADDVVFLAVSRLSTRRPRLITGSPLPALVVWSSLPVLRGGEVGFSSGARPEDGGVVL